MSGLFLFFNYGSPAAMHLLWATFGVMMIVKGLSYALNNPTKEMMYIPTSNDAKFKTKGWTDMFGGRAAKMLGARMSNWYKTDLSALLLYGTTLSLGLIGVWLFAALFVGRKNLQLTRDGEIIE